MSHNTQQLVLAFVIGTLSSTILFFAVHNKAKADNQILMTEQQCLAILSGAASK